MTQKTADLSIFNFSDYKIYLRTLIEMSSGQRGGKSALASAMGCQLPYLSRVLNGDADLSLEQADAAGTFFSFGKLERSYFLNLVCEARAGTSTLKEYWLEQRHQIKNTSKQLASRIAVKDKLSNDDMQIYYSQWYYTAIHMITGIPEFQEAQLISKLLQIPIKTVLEALNFLISIGLVANRASRFIRSTEQLHLKKGSTFESRHHLNWKLRAMNNLDVKSEDDLHYTSVVSLSKKDYEHLRDVFMKTIEKARATIRDSEDEVLACYILDLFKM